MTETPELHVPTHLKPGARLQHYKGNMYRVEGACLIEATLETGIYIQVPLFIKTGERIKVDTRTGKYMERA